MAAFPRSHHDPPNITVAPSPLPGIREHEAAPSLFPTRGSNNLVHASKVFPKRVPLYLLKKITNGFSVDRELGTGAYGKVYKGVHKNGETIAVKLLHSMPGLDDERFEEEFHNLAILQHKNIVRLVGFCHEIQREFVLHDGRMIFADSKHMALCFEYMHNGSLDKYIFDEYSGHDWPTRYAIIKGICEGLKYLHEELNPPIYHLDLKPANILLDDNMMPKLADFGLSKIFEQERTKITKSCIGTHGYLPPEYIDDNLISNKLDIFSLGVIIIKIITGPTGYTQCAEMPSKQFVELVHQRWKNRLQATPVDEYAPETYSEQVMRCIEMALTCVETDRHKRPSIGAIIEKLNKMDTTTDQVLPVDTSSSPAQASLLPATSYTTQATTNIKGVSRLREHVQYTMRDLVIGLAKSVVEVAQNKVQSAVELYQDPEIGEFIKREFGMIHSSLVFIKREFSMIHSSLKVTDEAHINDVVAWDWLRQVRELAYDLEDCIEVVFFLRRVDSRRNHLPSWSRLFACLDGLCSSLATALATVLATPIVLATVLATVLPTVRETETVLATVLPTVFATVLSTVLAVVLSITLVLVVVYQLNKYDIYWTVVSVITYQRDKQNMYWVAVSMIEALRVRVKDFSHKNSRYSFISNSGSKSKPVLAQQQPAPPNAVGYDTGRHHILGDLTQLITDKDDADLQVISVWGADGGIGTTSIIRSCYSDPEIIQSFICRAWVNLTHPFNPREFVRSLMAHFYANSCQERKGAVIGVDVLTGMDASADLLSEFVQIVDKNRYLVVLEDLTTMAEWDSIRTFLPNRKNGSWIVVSSQKYEVASLCVGHSYQVLDLKQLPGEHHICAFLREGFEDAGDKSEANNDSTSTRSNEISTEYDFSHNQRNVYSSYHRIVPNSKMKAARDWMQNSSLVGRRLQMDQLRHCTVQAQMNHSQVMSVWGIPGVGKSALVRNLYCDRILENQQFQEYGWVGLSHSRPFNLRDFSRSLLMNFHSESLQAKETAPSNIVGIKDAIGKCREVLSTRRCLVVIDGLQSIQEWDLIQSSLVSRHSESRTVIIVITTEASIATYCADKEELAFNVKTLEADAAFDLFKNEVASKKTLLSASPSYRENAVLRELISKCGGLPSIIVAMAGILATKAAWMDAAGSINLRFINEVEMNPEFDSLWDLFSWMHSCFRTCPDSIKPCIFYLSCFPRDHNIRRRRLVRRWIAEGYSRDSDDKSAEENGEEFFSKLLNLSIIQPESSAISDARVVLCRVNGFLRECILSRAMEENLVFELTDTSSPTTKSSGRHLVISENWDRNMTVFQRIDFSRLRSMTVVGMWKSFFISKSMKLLRVLDLEDSLGLTDADVEQMVKRLCCLKFLSLRGCRGIFHLPSSIGGLRQLQTLDVMDTSIVTLPATITKLQMLQYIRGGTPSISSEDPSVPNASSSWLSKFHHLSHLVGVGVPSGIRELRSLHTLGVVNIGSSAGEAILKALKKLTQLRKLGVFGVNRNNSMAFSSAISGHVHLESLSVWFDKESQCCLDDTFLPLKNLQSLKLYGLVDKLQVLQIDQLSKLAKLDLEITTLREWDIRFLGELPKLCILRLCVNQPEDVRLHFCVFIDGVEQRSYQKLKWVVTSAFWPGSSI
ncbi:uncharacterized protein [Miscanthus floridulus]|uniref:uncharacterized protein isoform X2 n=1 Tax=Miscanthus floridulus TaxID=154761 RepID=UPI003459CEDA